jgi:Ca2+-binding EF-hand superfamily protein
MGQGSIQSGDLQSAFDRISGASASPASAAGTPVSATDLFSKLDGDSDGKITRSEFSASINQLAGQLDQHYMRMRMPGACALPPAGNDAGFTREELTSQIANIAGNFDRADADGNGRVSLREARAFLQPDAGGSATTAQTASADNRNVELMLQVVRLMQAYGVVNGANGTANNGNDGNSTAASRISVLG